MASLQDGQLINPESDKNGGRDALKILRPLIIFHPGLTKGRKQRKARSIADRLEEKKKETIASFINSIRQRNTALVQEKLREDVSLAMCVDENGESALVEAVRAGSDVIHHVLEGMADLEKQSRAFWIEYALCYAIKLDNSESARILLDKTELLLIEQVNLSESLGAENSTAGTKTHQQNSATAWRHKSSQKLLALADAAFPPYLTPVVLAAQMHRVEILKLILDRNMSEIHPISESCPFNREGCEICTDVWTFKEKRDVEGSRRLIEIYKALSSPSYILHSGVADPVLEAFELSRRMENFATDYTPFKKEYEEIRKHYCQVACDLIDLCRSNQELKALLTICNGFSEIHTYPPHKSYVVYPRLHVALSYAQKEFVTHPASQQLLEREWYGWFPNWVCNTKHTSFRFFLYVLLWCAGWPFMCLLGMFQICPKLMLFVKRPVNKFISDHISYVAFLLLLFVECSNNKKNQRASDLFTQTEYLIILWIVGMVVRQAKMLYLHRKRLRTELSLTSAQWWLDSFLLVMFFMWIILYCAGIGKMYSDGKENDLRHEWENNNLILVSEGFFSFGTLFAFLRLQSLLKVNNALGTLTISFKLMLADFIRVVILFVISLTGFALALTNIYSHYKDHTGEGELPEEPLTLFTVWESYTTLAWTVFGHGDISLLHIAIYDTENNDRTANATTPSVIRHEGTQWCGYLLFGLYHVVAIFVLVNLLTAMMTNSYKVIEQNSAKEWKFELTRLRMLYISDIPYLPPPFNLALDACCGYCNCKCSSSKTYPEEEKYANEEQYKELVSTLGKRYLSEHREPHRANHVGNRTAEKIP